MWAATAVCMIFIVAFWLRSLNNLNARFSQTISGQEEIGDTLKQFKEDVPTLWQSLSAGIGGVLDLTKEKMQSQPSETTSSDSTIQETPEGKLPIE